MPSRTVGHARTAAAPGALVRKVPQVMQMEALECGAACLTMVSAYYGKWLPLEQVRRDCGVSRDGQNALNIVKAARSYGFVASGRRYEPESLFERATFPCIVHWDFNHFIVVCGRKGDRVLVNDPARGRMWIPYEEFDQAFTGVALLIAPGEGFEPSGQPASVLEFARERLRGAVPMLAFVAVATALSSALSMASPALSQFFLDELLTGRSLDLAAAFMAVLGAVCVVQVAVAIFEAIYLLRLEGKLAVSSSVSFMWHVLRLPMEFFSQRMPADVAARQTSNASVAQDLVSMLAPLVIDAAMLMVYLVIMVTYSAPLAAIGIASVLVNTAVAGAISKSRVNVTRVMMRDEANLSTATMTAISQIETLKASGSEGSFFQRWAGYQAGANAQRVRLAEVDQRLGLVPQVVTSCANVAVLACGVWLILSGSLTTGMLLAFQGYLSQFAAPVQSLISSMQGIQEMRTEMERIKDVMDYPTDPFASETDRDISLAGKGEKGEKDGRDAPVEKDDPADPLDALDALLDQGEGLEKLAGRVTLEGVTFGYSPLADPLIEDFSLDVAPGGSVAIVGPSGSGKSTVAKLMSGLYSPWAGEVLLDGTPLAEVAHDVRCASVAVIDQDITVFADTISNNIRHWDESIEDFEVVLAARDAGVHDVIMRREGGYEGRLAEGGRDLSGGQRQRLEIARALAQDPTVLIMDEATSALDAQTEAEVMEAVRKRGITLVIIAHRLSAVRDCDQIIVLDRGHVVEQGTHDELMALDGAYAHLVSME